MQSKTWVAAVVMLLVAGLRLTPVGATLDETAFTNWIMEGVTLLGPVFVILRGVYMGRHTITGRTLPSR
jgi:hypothetical protein